MSIRFVQDFWVSQQIIRQSIKILLCIKQFTPKKEDFQAVGSKMRTELNKMKNCSSLYDGILKVFISFKSNWSGVN